MESERQPGPDRRRLIIALALITGSLAVELGGAFLSGSLALLADAGDMVTNLIAIGLALLSLWLGERPATVARTFGLLRTETLAALANALTLWVIAVWILFEAYERLMEAQEVEGEITLVAGLIVLACNIGAAFALRKAAQRNITVDGAFRHIVADALGSVGVVISGILIVTLDLVIADTIVSILLVVFIVFSSIGLLREVFHVLLEGTPEEVDVYRLCHDIEDEPGVTLIHDVHVWTIASGYNAFTAHVLVDPAYTGSPYDLVSRLAEVVRNDGNIAHVTIQLEQSAETCTENHHVDHLLARARPVRKRRWPLPFL